MTAEPITDNRIMGSSFLNHTHYLQHKSCLGYIPVTYTQQKTESGGKAKNSSWQGLDGFVSHYLNPGYVKYSQRAISNNIRQEVFVLCFRITLVQPRNQMNITDV